MKPIEELSASQPIASLADVSERAWVLLGLGELPSGSCYVADASAIEKGAVAGEGAWATSAPDAAAGGAEASGKTSMTSYTNPHCMRIVAFFDGTTGNVFPCPDGTAEPNRKDGPAVHVIGELEGESGQVTVRQERGNYLRICRWDRVDSSAPLLQGALLRTLPQCGCGGSLGAPKLFSSFAEMGAYHFCAFYLPSN